MLLQLSIQNFALIDDIKLEFDQGLNVLTGETGAGKSILLDALRLVLGERMESGQLRSKELPCVLTAVFSVSPQFVKNNEVIAALLPEGDEYLILKRETAAEGRSKCSVNGNIVNLSQLKTLGKALLDFHGQYDQQRILEKDAHRELLDRLAGLDSQQTHAYGEVYANYLAVRRRKKELVEACADRERQIDLLSYQVKEIEEISPEPGEDEKLKEEHIRLAHAEKLNLAGSNVLQYLEEAESNASGLLVDAYRELTSLARIDESTKPLLERFETVQIELEDLIREIRGYRDDLSTDVGDLKSAEQRLDSLDLLKRKYGGDLVHVLAFLEKASKELDQLTNSDLYQKELDAELTDLNARLKKGADKISRGRKKAAEELNQSVAKELKDLGIKHARFECRVLPSEFNAYGADDVEFYLSPNAGQPLKPLVNVASAGEASRMILALKRSLMKADFIPTLVFDEIDANIGGRLGDVVGQKLKEVASERQILLITHLPQIASFGERHIKVTKSVHKGRTLVQYAVLEGDARVRELAQMMSGEKETRISHDHAREMLKTANK